MQRYECKDTWHYEILAIERKVIVLRRILFPEKDPWK